MPLSSGRVFTFFINPKFPSFSYFRVCNPNNSMKKLFTGILLALSVQAFPQVSLLRTIELPYPVHRIIHFPKCGDSPLYLCRKSGDTMVVINGDATWELPKDELVIFADHTRLFTSHNISQEKIQLRRYDLTSGKYVKTAEKLFDRVYNGVRYNMLPVVVDEILHYFVLQPFSSTTTSKALLQFFDPSLQPVFQIQEELSSYNMHCFGHDSILILKEYFNTQNLTTHLYDHTGKLLSDETFHLSFKPQADAPVFEYMKDDGIVVVVEQSDEQKTHVMKFAHSGKLLWDLTLDDYFYNFEEHGNILASYGGGKKTPHRLVFVNDETGKILSELNLHDAYMEFTHQEKLENIKTTFFPIGLNSNPEKTWLTIMINIFSQETKTRHWDRILIYRNPGKIEHIDLSIPGSEMPKVIPTDGDHLIVGIGTKVSIYRLR